MTLSSEETGPPQEVSRREFVASSLLAVAFVALGAGAVNAVVRFLNPPKQGIGGGELEVAAKAEIPVGQSKNFTFQDSQYMLVHVDQGFKAFSRVCPHAGCLVTWDGSSQVFKCPCHAAVFDRTGAVVSGPAPKPLAELKVAEIGGKLVVGGG